jgi:uncharacterized membrane protein YdjX (TVP38/TMEM64 family)
MLDFIQKNWQKLVAAALWLSALAAYVVYTQANQLTPLAAVQALMDAIRGTWYGPLVFILIYTLRPLIFFPATLLTVAGGFLFGPVLGFIFSTLGGNLSSVLSYGVGRYFGQGLLNTENSTGLIQNYATRLRQNSFETVLVMRFLFLPYDLVSYLCGFLKIDWRGFLLATFLGGLPGGMSIVALGASVQGDLTNFTPRLEPATLAFAAVMFIISLALSRYFKRREAARKVETTS